jgi:Protein of unknown function (DUF2934)
MNLGARSDNEKGGRLRTLLVSLRARQIWREKGERPGNDVEDWNQAELEYAHHRFGLISRIIFNIPEPVLKSLDLYLKMIILPITLVAGIAAVANYLETTKQDALKISLSYADRYEQDALINIRDTLAGFFGSDEMLHVTSTDYDDKVNVFVATGDNRKSIMRNYYLFNEMAFCSNKNICNREFLCGRFSGDVGAFRNNLFDYFKTLSNKWNECLTAEIDTFLTSCGVTFRSWPKDEKLQCN